MANLTTLQAYEQAAGAYIANTVPVTTGEVQEWIDRTLDWITTAAKIVEIGSASGRDALYMEKKGYSVERTDAAHSFVQAMEKSGYRARLFNILTDSFTDKVDLLFANAVFLHFTEEEFRSVLLKIKSTLSNDGLLAFSVKQGEGEEWTKEKVGLPRYFRYWKPDPLSDLLKECGFILVEMAVNQDQKWIRVIAKSH